MQKIRNTATSEISPSKNVTSDFSFATADRKLSCCFSHGSTRMGRLANGSYLASIAAAMGSSLAITAARSAPGLSLI